MIDVQDLVVRQGSFQLDGVSLVVPKGHYAILTGKSGSGKTTLLECICGLRPIMSGVVCLGGIDRTRAQPRAREIGYVPQDGALFPTKTVAEQLAFPLSLRAWPPDRARDRISELAEFLQIQHLLKRTVRALSGGEIQRVAIGRALSFEPPVLLLDEPLSALDTETCAAIRELLRAIHRRTGTTILHATHRPDEVQQLAQMEWRLNDGRMERTLISDNA